MPRKPRNQPTQADAIAAVARAIQRELRWLPPPLDMARTRRSAAYQHGYQAGILHAHCLMAWALYPRYNADDIRRELAKLPNN